jgi:hypothetical protein
MEDREQDVRDDRVGGLAVEVEVDANPAEPVEEAAG